MSEGARGRPTDHRRAEQLAGGSARHVGAPDRHGGSACIREADDQRAGSVGVAALVTADDILVGVATGQHGVAARWQLVEAGMSLHAIEYRLLRRRLERVYRGVYRYAPMTGPRWREMAAVLSGGASAVLSYRSAAAAWGQIRASGGSATSVAITRGNPTSQPGVRFHRLRTLLAAETTHCDGVPITTPARTLVDLASCASDRELEQAVAHSLRQGLASDDEIVRIVARYPRRAGVRHLRALMCLDGAPAFTRSQAEETFLDLVRRAHLPPPETNVVVHGWEVDCLWRNSALVVEIDGRAFHSSYRAQARDRRRDATLLAQGLSVMRVTWADLHDGRDALIARLAQALVRRRPA
jgi:very-short-patch-repair endonuclease